VVLLLLLLLLPPLFFSAFFSFVLLFLFPLLLLVFFFFLSVSRPSFSLVLPPYSLVFFFVLPPCFYSQKQGRDMAGVATMLPPHDCRRTRFLLFSPPCGRPRVRVYTSGVMIGVFLMLFGERGGEKSVKNLLLPLPRTSRGRRRPTMPFKTALFWVFPFF